MAATRKARVPMAEQIRLIDECRQSGMTDADWCRENDIAVSTFYNWISRRRKAAADQIPAPNSGHHTEPLLKQDVVPIEILPERLPVRQMHLDNSHTIEVTMKNVTIRINYDADPDLLTRTFCLLREASCWAISLDLKNLHRLRITLL